MGAIFVSHHGSAMLNVARSPSFPLLRQRSADAIV